MGCCEFRFFVTGYSQLVDAIVRQRLYLFPRGGMQIFGGTSTFAPKREEMKKLAFALSLFLMIGMALADIPKDSKDKDAEG